MTTCILFMSYDISLLNRDPKLFGRSYDNSLFQKQQQHQSYITFSYKLSECISNRMN